MQQSIQPEKNLFTAVPPKVLLADVFSGDAWNHAGARMSVQVFVPCEAHVRSCFAVERSAQQTVGISDRAKEKRSTIQTLQRLIQGRALCNEVIFIVSEIE
jgi:hypothetical protein